MTAIPQRPGRRAEIQRLLAMPAEEVRERAGHRLVVTPDLDAVHQAVAEEMVARIRACYGEDKPAVMVLPVGPVGQYPIFAEIANRERLNLRNCHFFFMDEYADETGKAFPASHPLSFGGAVQRVLLAHLDPELAPPPEQLIVPSHENIGELVDRIDALGGLDVCFGGIGIHGHLAFNEPEPGVREAGPRLVELNPYTITINALRAEVGGNLEGFPRQAYTLGLPQLLGARRLRLACRNGIPYDWANTVLRLTLFGEPGEDYPCTFAHQHPDLRVYTDLDTLRCPKHVL